MGEVSAVNVRQCGECTICCDVLAVRELSKPGCKQCSQVIPEKGCRVYEYRPDSCKSFECLWLAAGRHSERAQQTFPYRPDECGVMFSAVDDGPRFEEEFGCWPVQANEAFPGGFDIPEGKEAIKKVLEQKTVVIMAPYSDTARSAYGNLTVSLLRQLAITAHEQAQAANDEAPSGDCYTLPHGGCIADCELHS